MSGFSGGIRRKILEAQSRAKTAQKTAYDAAAIVETHQHDAADIVSGTLATAGTVSVITSTTILRRDWGAEGLIAFKTGSDITSTGLFVGFTDTSLGSAVTPTAAMLREIRTRLKDLGITQVVQHGSSAARLAEAMRAKGLKLTAPPPVSDSDEEAA